jgi:hypothetical protein
MEQMTKAERSTIPDGLAYHRAQLKQCRRKRIFRRVLNGGCVLLQPGHYWSRYSECTTVLSEKHGDEAIIRSANRSGRGMLVERSPNARAMLGDC